MSSPITTATVQQYNNVSAMLLQQGGSKLLSKVSKQACTGKAAKVLEQFGKVNAHEVTTRHADVQYTITPQSARWVHPKKFRIADLIDDDDKRKMLVDATAAYAKTQMYGIGRQIDQHIVDQVFGTNYTGENGTTSTAFDTANQQIAANSLGLTFDKIREAKKILWSNDWDDENDPCIMVIAAKQGYDLLGMTQATNRDYTGMYTIDKGRVNSFLGLEIVTISNDILPLSGSNRRCFVMPRSAFVLGEWKGVTGKMDVLPQKGHAVQVLTECMYGGTRTEEGRVVEIQCAE